MCGGKGGGQPQALSNPACWGWLGELGAGVGDKGMGDKGDGGQKEQGTRRMGEKGTGDRVMGDKWIGVEGEAWSVEETPYLPSTKTGGPQHSCCDECFINKLGGGSMVCSVGGWREASGNR